MRLFLGITDWEWFELLAAQPDLVELNFWQPSPRRFHSLAPGELFLFKLKRSAAGGRDVVAGGGFYATGSELPVSMAWESFGVANGARTFAEMRARIARLRGTDPGPADYRIGCILLSQPFFFPPEQWIDVPGWPGSLQSGKSYDAAEQPGSHILREVELRLRARGLIEPEPAMASEGPRYREALTRQRIGQGTFRVLVTDTYQRACAITREKALPTLEAAHIRPYAEGGQHDVRNGLLLRSDVHRLFDAGYVTVTPEHRVEVSRRLETEFNNGAEYLAMHGREIWLPKDGGARPEREFLEWHNENRFVA